MLFEKNGILVGQSSNVLLPGQTLTITAGVGSYSNDATAKIKINNRLVPTEDAVAVTKIKVPRLTGNYKMPMEILYINHNGEEINHKTTIEYKVVKAIE